MISPGTLSALSFKLLMLMLAMSLTACSTEGDDTQVENQPVTEDNTDETSNDDSLDDLDTDTVVDTGDSDTGGGDTGGGDTGGGDTGGGGTGGGGTGGGGTGGGGSASRTGIFMNIDDNLIVGDSTDDTHKDWIEVLSYSEGSANSASLSIGSGGTAGKLNLQDVMVVKHLDRSSPELRLSLARGDIFTEVKIDIVRQCGGEPYKEYEVTLVGPMLSSLTASTSGNDDLPTESVTFNFTRIESWYTPVGKDCKPGTSIFSYQDAFDVSI